MEAFGFLNNTSQIWPEKLQEKLNTEKPFKNFEKYEVLNLAYHNYDLASQAERFKVQGKDFKPDLIIWLNNDFSRVNNLFFVYVDYVNKDFQQGRRQAKEGEYFPIWQQVYNDYIKNTPWQKIISYQEKVLTDFLFFKGDLPVVFLSFVTIPEELRKVLENNNALVFTLSDFTFANNPDLYFSKNLQSLNQKGHLKLSEAIFNLLTKNQAGIFQQKKEKRNQKQLSFNF